MGMAIVSTRGSFPLGGVSAASKAMSSPQNVACYIGSAYCG